MGHKLFIGLVSLVLVVVYFGIDRQLIKNNLTMNTMRLIGKARMEGKTNSEDNAQWYGSEIAYKNLLLYRKSFVAKKILQVSDVHAEGFYLENEKDILADPALNDFKVASSEKFSVLVTNRRYYTLGETIQVYIRINNGYRLPKSSGGDDVRVWMSNDEYACAAEVTDLYNGTYAVRLKALWPGKAQIKASLAFSREEVRVLLDTRRRLKVLRYTLGKFSKMKTEGEITLCSPFPDIPGSSGVCNFTKWNLTPYYCGKPISSTLNCSDWKDAITVSPNKQLMTKTEYEMLSRKSRRIMIDDTETIKILEGYQPTLPDCNKVDKSITWSSIAPNGHFKGDIWYPSFCNKTLTSATLPQCLRNTTLTLIGDSTVRQWYEAIIELINCKGEKTDKVELSKRVGRYCVIPEIGFNVTFGIHGFPYSAADKMDTITNMRNIGLRLEETRITEKHIVVVHLYLHFLFFHMSVYVSRVRALRDALTKLLEKHPHIKIAIKGPHAFTKVDNKPIVKSDYFGRVCARILKRELSELWHRIWFIDLWDMSVSVQNVNIHPKWWFVDENVKLLFNFVCD